MDGDMVISIEDIREVLTTSLEREPTERELERFKDFLETDLPQWLVDNAKYWIREVFQSEK